MNGQMDVWVGGWVDGLMNFSVEICIVSCVTEIYLVL